MAGHAALILIVIEAAWSLGLGTTVVIAGCLRRWLIWWSITVISPGSSSRVRIGAPLVHGQKRCRIYISRDVVKLLGLALLLRRQGEHKSVTGSDTRFSGPPVTQERVAENEYPQRGGRDSLLVNDFVIDDA